MHARRLTSSRPLIGGFVVEKRDWRWTQWVVLFFIVVVLTPAFGIRETYKKRILEVRAKGLSKQNPKHERTHQSRTDVRKAAEKFVRSTLTRPIHMLFTEPIPGLFSLYVAFNFALQYSFFVAFPTVFEEVYGFNLGSQGLTFLGLGVGIFVGLAILILNNIYIYRPRVARWRAHASEKNSADGNSITTNAVSTPPPEWRLVVAFPGSLLIPIALFMFAWTARPSVPWIVPIIAEALFGIGQLLIFMSATMYVMDTYGPLYGASAMAANTLLRYIMGFAFPLFVGPMYKKLGVAWATSLLGFLSILLMLIPWCFWVWGPKLRSMSKYRHGA
jgi:hypothetical protein